MLDNADSERFEEIVKWAYGTLPQNIRDLPDFPGIQVVDEPSEEMLKRKQWPPRKEMLGLYSGIRRTERLYNRIRMAPDLIFIFRGPIQRCSRGDLQMEVKEVVWHEVAHWLGCDEQDVMDLGLATLSLPVGDAARPQVKPKAKSADFTVAKTTTQRSVRDNLDEVGELEKQQLRCVKCYSGDIDCRDFDKPMTSYGAWLSDPLPVHVKLCRCKSCGYEWDDEEST